jgi:hypothetical protein
MAGALLNVVTKDSQNSIEKIEKLINHQPSYCIKEKI